MLSIVANDELTATAAEVRAGSHASSSAPGKGRQCTHMDSAEWDQRYAGREVAWSSEANRFVVREVTGVAFSKLGIDNCGASDRA